MSVFFYDSYAVIEHIEANPTFSIYFEKHSGMLTLLNVLEIYYSTLVDLGEQKANLVLETIKPLVVEPTNETIVKAMKFKRDNKKWKLSYADCLGYQIALEKRIKFLTGDKQFKELPNVEFIK